MYVLVCMHLPTHTHAMYSTNGLIGGIGMFQMSLFAVVVVHFCFSIFLYFLAHVQIVQRFRSVPNENWQSYQSKQKIEKKMKKMLKFL